MIDPAWHHEPTANLLDPHRRAQTTPFAGRCQ